MGRETAREILVRNLRRLMAEQEITGADLSRLSGVSRGFVSRIANGHQNPSLEVLEAFADVLAVPVRELLDERPAAAPGYERVNLVLPVECAEQAKVWALKSSRTKKPSGR